MITQRRVYEGTIYYNSVISVTIDRGRAEGVKKGMRLYISGSKEGEEVEIISAGKHSSKGIIERVLDDQKRATFRDWETKNTHPYPEITAGQRVTTSYHLSK